MECYLYMLYYNNYITTKPSYVPGTILNDRHTVVNEDTCTDDVPKRLSLLPRVTRLVKESLKSNPGHVAPD